MNEEEKTEKKKKVWEMIEEEKIEEQIEEQMKEIQKYKDLYEKHNVVKAAKRELKFSSRGLLLEFLYIIKDFFFISEVAVIDKKLLVLKFYNGQVFEVKVTERIKETTRLL